MTGMTDKKIQVNKIIDFLLKPFGENLAFFLALWLLASAADIFFYAKSGNPVFGTTDTDAYASNCRAEANRQADYRLVYSPGRHGQIPNLTTM